MNTHWRRLAVLLVFLALPLQGVAASIHALACLSGGEVTHAMQAHDDGANASSHGHDDGSGAGVSDASHFCCNLAAPGVLTAPTSAAQGWPPVFDSPISLFATLFVPEQPQRPPRS